MPDTYYVVVSPPEWMNVDELYTYLKKEFSQFTTGVCIKEFGKSGDHPHLNWIVQDPPSYVEVMESLEAYAKTLYYPCGKRRRMTATMRKHILSYQEVYDAARLDMYLHKEEGAVTLHEGHLDEVEWEFSWYETTKFDTTMLVNIRNWMSNYPIVKALRIYEDEAKFENEVRKMLLSVRDIQHVYKWNRCRYDTREAVRKTLQTELKK